MFSSLSVAMLKQVIFNHMLSREADDRRHSGAPDGQQGDTDESSVSTLLADSQGQNTQLLRGQMEASDTTEQNGEATIRRGVVVMNFE